MEDKAYELNDIARQSNDIQAGSEDIEQALDLTSTLATISTKT